jgi:hypothetical protein
MIVRGHVNAVYQVIGVHDCARLRFPDGGLKGGKINLAQGPFIDVGADLLAVVFLVVAGKMFDGGNDSPARIPSTKGTTIREAR